MRKLLPILLSTLLFSGCVAPHPPTNTYRRIPLDEAVTIGEDRRGVRAV